MEETAQKERETRDKIVASLQEVGHSVSSVTPETENPLEIAEEILDMGGKNEGHAPSKSFLARLKARVMGTNRNQAEDFKKAA
ncbi:MAG: hypothetical protein HYW45_02205 [Candidatus Daviesbacteria bacterium]|nr:MAG: hypothetical protein HYW45_02205 [Candidatus Daviesbacteria bacterium]